MNKLARRVAKLEEGIPAQDRMSDELKQVAAARFMYDNYKVGEPHPAAGGYTEAEIKAATDVVVREIMEDVASQPRLPGIAGWKKAGG